MYKDSIPLIMTHRGYSRYLEYTLRQAKKYNRKKNVILLGDNSNHFPFVTHCQFDDYSGPSVAAFTARYKHLSTNPYDIELYCFLRWFIIRDYMKRHDIQRAFICDTDVLLYANVNEIYNTFNEKEVYLMVREYGNPELPPPPIVSGGQSFWTLTMLDRFCNFLEHFYEKYEQEIAAKMKYHLSRRQTGDNGGICDMTAVGFFYLENQSVIGNILSVKNHSTTDGTLSSSNNALQDEYEVDTNGKKFVFKKGIPFCYNPIIKEEIKFYLLHFQGPSKYLIKNYYRGSRFFLRKGFFQEKISTLHDLVFRLLRKIKRLASFG
jgi:hypothetical protein